MDLTDPIIGYEISRNFGVSRQKLFNAFIDGETLTKIWGVSEISVDAKPGGQTHAKLQYGAENWDFTITYREVVVCEKLKWVVQFKRFPQKEILVTLHFHDTESGSKLIFAQENFESPAERDGNRNANEQALEKLGKILSG